jgi:hypothetical protein
MSDSPGGTRGRRDTPAVCAARHGIATPRGLDAAASPCGGRFGRMFPDLPACEISDDSIEKLAAVMKGISSVNGLVPSGYTYLGQFIDHDITFDPQSSLERANDPYALVNFRTPRFDLDSLYGSGPDDQPFLYDWNGEPEPGVKLLVGHNRAKHEAQVDLPRNEQGRALIGDARNDENRITSQLHLLFIRFHNKVVERLAGRPSDGAGGTLFEQAQRVVRWHYQWIVVHDFLAHVLGRFYEALRGRADGTVPAARRWLSASRDGPAMPVEFSGAAYRFGHSMVRGDYHAKGGGPAFPIFRLHGDERPSFAGFGRLPSELEIEWDLFFFDGLPSEDHPDRNFSMRIDTSLAPPLSHLPVDDGMLARLNLRRGRALGLPSGPDVAREMGLVPLDAAQVQGLSALPAPAKAQLQQMLDVLPLWVYVLLEAMVLGGAGTSLGPVGCEIVSEVLLGLLEADPSSYLHRRGGWTPELSDHAGGDFTMRDLVRYVEDPDWL